MDNRSWSQALLVIAPLLASLGCNDAGSPTDEGVEQVTSALTDPIGICNQDPRVNSGLVPLQVCAGARVFFDEKFNGNGRTCGSCHPAQNNFTLDKPFIATLPATDPLFVAENPQFQLSALETPALHMVDALIKENVDGFDINQPGKFVSRAVSHIFSLATSITRDPADGTSASVPQRTGWGGDGAPDGTLRTFVDGAIRQHLTQRLQRVAGTDFRLPTDAERDEILAFQLAVGRTADINLGQVTLTDAGAAAGKTAFMDPLVGRCNECHSNAGANALASGKNRNFNTGTVTAPAAPIVALGTFPDGSFLLDGGFGGQGLQSPNFRAGSTTGPNDSFGDGTFNTPPLIEAADTGPFFHQHGFGQGSGDPTASIESGVAFYATGLFLQSPAAQELDAKFHQPVNVGPSIGIIGRFLRVLNASFNLALARQRLDASRTLNIQYWAYRDDIQKGLLGLASKEIDDARRVLVNGGADLHAAQQTSLANAQTLLSQAIAATDPATRKARTESAITIVQAAKDAFGTNMNFQLGTGNLMF